MTRSLHRTITGGSELITEWTGKDGTDALLSAHPGGTAYIKHTLGAKDFAAAYRGSYPYDKSSRKKKPKKKRRSAKSVSKIKMTRLLWRVLLSALLVAGCYYVWSNKPNLQQILPHGIIWSYSGPSLRDAAYFLFGVAVGTFLFTRALRQLGVGAFSPSVGSGVGGWAYAAVSPTLIERLREICPEEDQVSLK